MTIRSSELLLDGLAAARNALARDDRDAAAWFNAGRALEELGLLAEARQDYKVVQRLEPGDGWATEAAQRSKVLAVSDPDVEWKLIANRLRNGGDPSAAEAHIAQESGTARRMAEWTYLVDWASARVANDRTATSEALTKARIVAGALLRQHRERLLSDAVSAIDRSEANGTAPDLARAHIAYDKGRALLRANDAEGALAKFNEAATAFARAGSPIEYLAKYYASGAFYSQGRITETLAELTEVDRINPWDRGYRALTAQLGWHRGICLVVRGQYAEAVDVFQRSSAIAAEIKDALLVAQFDNLASEAMEYLGRTNDAWRLRTRALRGLSRLSASQRVTVTLMSAANLQLARREWQRCIVLHDSALPMALSSKDPVLTTFVLAQRAIAHEELGHVAAAAADRQRAALWLTKITEPKLQHRLGVEVDIATGVALRTRSPQHAITYFDSAIRQFETSGERAHLPRLYLERGRAYEALGDDTSYRANLARALALTDSWRDHVADMDERAALNIWSDSVRRDAIALELRSRNVAAAFDLTERGRSVVRPLPLARVSASLAGDAAVIEYVITPRGIVALIIRDRIARAVLLPGHVEEIAAAANRFRETGSDSAGELWRLVISPIRPFLSDVAIVDVVPERELSGIPFNALYDTERRRFLLDDFAVVHSSSADAAIRASRPGGPTTNHALVVGADVFSDNTMAPLPAVADEARNVARSWRDATLLLGREATGRALRNEAPHATAIHYAGHIVHRGGSSQLLLSDGFLSMQDIAHMPLDNVRVVILAACRGTELKTSNALVTDAASAFLTAKAHTVVASASDLDDSQSAAVMARLSPLLAHGIDPAVAVQRAAIAELHEMRNSSAVLKLMVLGGSPRLLRTNGAALISDPALALLDRSPPESRPISGYGRKE